MIGTKIKFYHEGEQRQGKVVDKVQIPQVSHVIQAVVVTDCYLVNMESKTEILEYEKTVCVSPEKILMIET